MIPAVSCSDEFISNIFLVPKKTGDFRPVINLKPLNSFVQEIHFKMESINLACSFIKPGDFMASLDLKDAYFSIPIFQPHRKYLRFLWKGQRYEFTCLPFGYSLAPRVFTKVLKPVIATLRFRGIRLVVFIDDILVIASSAQQCSDHLAEALALLRSLGFTINFKKSNLTPVSNIIYLGFLINSVSMKLFLPEDKISKVILACQQLVSSTKPTVRMVAHVTGLLVSAFPAVKGIWQ